MLRMIWVLIRLRTVRFMAAEKRLKRSRCRSRSAETCCSLPRRLRSLRTICLSSANMRSRSANGRNILRKKVMIPKISFAPMISPDILRTIRIFPSKRSLHWAVSPLLPGCLEMRKRRSVTGNSHRNSPVDGSPMPTTGNSTVWHSIRKVHGVRNTIWSGTVCSDSVCFRSRLRKRKWRTTARFRINTVFRSTAARATRRSTGFSGVPF